MPEFTRRQNNQELRGACFTNQHDGNYQNQRGGSYQKQHEGKTI
jgi:hypothetical protein